MDSLEDHETTPTNESCDLSPKESDPDESNKFYMMELLIPLDAMGESTLQQATKTQMKTPIDESSEELPMLGLCLDTLFNRSNSIPPRHPSSSTQQQQQQQHVVTVNLSPYKRKSEAIGNGWNAKGLQKAKAGEWEEAILCWDNALEIRLQVLGKDHPDVANTLNNIGIAFGRLEKYDHAMDCLNRALKIRTVVHGELHLEIAATLHNIGNIFQQMKDYDGALRCFEEAKKTQIVLKDHVLVARTCNAIGHLQFEYQKFDKALVSYEEALSFFIKAGYGDGDDEYDTVLEDICDAKQEAETT
jgi:tetratricopeptide (TPR) repeat protein